jgi:uncharacterized membrane protein YfcA
MLELAVITLFCLLGVITQRIIGFGIAAFLAPVALIFFEPASAVVLTILVGTLSCLIIVYQTRNRSAVILPLALKMSVWAIPGLLLGSYVVTRIDKGMLQIIVGSVVIIGVLIQEYIFPKPTKSITNARGVSITGLFAGFFSATAANGAASMVMWIRRHIATPDQIRQNFAAIFILINMCSLSAIYIQKPEVYDSQVFGHLVVLIPVVLLANAVGGWFIKKVNTKLYEKLIVVCIILTGLVTIGLGFTNLN